MSERPPLIAGLLAAERAAPPIDPATRARLRERVMTGVAPIAADPPPAGENAATVAPTAAAPAAGKAGLLAVGKLAGVFALGVGVGAGGHAVLDRDRPSTGIAPSPAPAAQIASAPPDAGVAPPPDAGPTVDAGIAAVRPRRRAAPALERPADGELERERDLLEAARTALGRGEPAAALRHLGLHIARHPDGRLAEEREALRVQALAAAGDRARARAAAAAFERRFPASLFRTAVRESIGGAP